MSPEVVDRWPRVGILLKLSEDRETDSSDEPVSKSSEATAAEDDRSTAVGFSGAGTEESRDLPVAVVPAEAAAGVAEENEAEALVCENCIAGVLRMVRDALGGGAVFALSRMASASSFAR